MAEFVTITVVKFHVTGKVKEAPAFSGPVGKLALDAWKKSFPMVSPSNAVMATTAVQVTCFVANVPKATLPKSIGEVQFKGRLTGDPRQ